MQGQKNLRGFRDRDFIRTKEGFFFCVVGPYHPPDRVIAYVKYVPARSGKWRSEGTYYQRVMRAYTIPSLLETFNLLKTKYSQFLFHSEFYGITMTAVPRIYVAQHYRPEEKLARILHIIRKDVLQKKLASFVALLHEKSGIALEYFGITGSILLDIHDPRFSDIDLTIYGLQNCLKIKKTLNQLVGDPSSLVRRFQGVTLDEWCRKKVENFPLSIEDARRLYERKWNIGWFSGVPFSIHPVKIEDELTERYGDKTFRPEGQVVICAKITDDRESMFLPCVYTVHDVKVLKGNQDGSRISEVVSYESLYDSLAETGDEIYVKGKLESVCDNRDKREYYRVLVGSPEGKGKEYIKPAE
ncbi:MAG TPA: hypothetical protein VK487_04060 [Candidatus Bathyarchaeia archaeon]|nr:hypothetical protein [Candidatus Bathyarchaeia archaeon]